MSGVVNSIRLEMAKPVQRQSISVRCGDTNSRQVRFTLAKNGTVYDLSKAVFAVVKGKKPDNTEFFNDCQISGNEVFYNITTQTMAVAGEVLCELEVAFSDGSKITSPEFVIYVYQTQSEYGAESQNEYQGILAALSVATQAENDAKSAQTAARTYAERAENYAGAAAESASAAAISERNAGASETAAASSASAADASATAAAGSASDASTSATAAAGSATAAAGSATSAETSANAAAGSATSAAGSASASAASAREAAEVVDEASASATAAASSAAAAAESASAAEEAKEESEEILETMRHTGVALGTTHADAGYGDESRAAYNHSLVVTGNPHHVTKSDVGLGNADNTSDADKPVSSAQSAINTTIEGEIGTLSNLTTSAKGSAVAAINEVNAIAKGRNQAVAYNNYQAMVTALNAAAKSTFVRGQNIYISTLGVPDLWVYSVESTASTYTYVDDDTIANALKTGQIKVGYFKLSQLETQKVDLSTVNNRLAALETAVARIGYPYSPS